MSGIEFEQDRVRKRTDAGLSLAMVTEFLNKLDNLNQAVLQLGESQRAENKSISAIEAHLLELNHSVAKHNSWIDRYDERVAITIPALERRIDGNEEKNDKKYLSIENFQPFRSIISGAVALILISVVGALIALVILKPH